MPFDPITIAVILLLLLAGLIALASISAVCYLRGMDFNPLFQKREALKKEIESLQNVKSDLKAELDALRGEEAVAQRTIAEGKAEREWLDQNRDAIAEKREQIAKINEDLKDMVDKKNKLNEELQTLRQEQQKLAGENQAFSVANEQYRKDNEERQNRIIELDQKIKSLNDQITLAKEAEDKAHQEMLDMQNKAAQAQIEYERLKKEIENAEKKLEELKNDCKGFVDERKRLKDELKQVQKDIHQNEEKLHSLQSEVIAAAPINEEERWRDLDRPVPGFDFNIRATNMARRREETWLEQFEDNLRNSGIKFHQRTIRAFHTGLKVADLSPLVVLAGISGTGKSLLPRLYATAIGMNFLPIAVQPRWDNPQDMFGFYNYMEGRYKATELSRMLWQYDIYNNSSARDNLRGRQPMNLVLLDEMNIAKVEYYFSDMLSKLEVRRDINETNVNSRVKAEIEIECGSARQNSETRRLFVGRNTLFVGTMNEDESTQSLSDKVIDRSNLLRFGKPEEIDAHPNVETFNSQYHETGVIDYDNWIQWMNKDLSITEENLNIFRNINMQLEVLGHPFAYRVANAIQAYIINYPDQSLEGRTAAIADQVEMKVLPKLNGIDKDSQSNKKALKEIGDIIENDIGDSQLTDAFKHAMDDQDQVFFQWRGISR